MVPNAKTRAKTPVQKQKQVFVERGAFGNSFFSIVELCRTSLRGWIGARAAYPCPTTTRRVIYTVATCDELSRGSWRGLW